MGFGISGSDSFTSMDGADPVIAWIDESQGPMAVDYHLSGRFQVIAVYIVPSHIPCGSL